MQYYLHDVNPNQPNGVTFTREFLNNAISLFIPSLIMAIASDIVSGERTTGTIKIADKACEAMEGRLAN